ncbi:VOC family protein [Stappia sp.]|uniref:VOC family protein n=1 Tax=Stappia sp. TaxID=1870903 RepID=UPI003A998427
MKITPYLFFNGEGSEALDFYAGVFGSKPAAVMRMSDAPPDMPIPEDRKNWIMHSELPVGSGRIFLSDDVMSNPGPMQGGCSIMVELPGAEEARKVFDALSEGGEIRMEFQPTFWAAGFGTLTDRFGVRWMVGCEEAPQAA